MGWILADEVPSRIVLEVFDAAWNEGSNVVYMEELCRIVLKRVSGEWRAGVSG